MKPGHYCTSKDATKSRKATGIVRFLSRKGGFSLGIFFGIIAILVGVQLFLNVSPAGAATITVTGNGDSGAGTLRQAISDAAPGDTITFSSGMTVSLSSKAGGAADADSLFYIDKNLTIDGDLNDDGNADVTVDGQNLGRVLEIAAGAAVTLDGLIITNGKVTGAAGAAGTDGLGENGGNGATVRGGCIYNAGSLTILSGGLTQCTAIGGQGGQGGGGAGGGAGGLDGMAGGNGGNGGNGGSAYGGAVYNAGALLVNPTNVSFSTNSVVFGTGGNGGGGGGGGGAYYGDSGSNGNGNSGGAGGMGGYNVMMAMFEATGGQGGNGGTEIMPAGDGGQLGSLVMYGTSGNGGMGGNIGTYGDALSADIYNGGILGNIITVNTAADNTTAGDGFCTLREAMFNAESTGENTSGDCAAGTGNDVITFAGDYTITLSGNQLPAMTRSLTITGNGTAKTIIQAAATPDTATSRVFEVGTGGSLTLNDLTIKNGVAATDGGGIYNLGGTLVLNNVDVLYNHATQAGGGIYASGPTTLNGSLISANTADNFGGGIYCSGTTCTISRSTLSANHAREGGGINQLGTLMISDSAITGNTSSQDGGGITSFGTTTAENSTISGNIAADDGGGLANASGAMSLSNCTVSGNIANGTVNGVGGGGIYQFWPDGDAPALQLINTTVAGNSHATAGGEGIQVAEGSATWTNSIIAGNGAQNCAGAGTVTSLGHNLASDNTCSLTGTGDLPNTAPLLAGLADNGGFTQTMALLAGSPALEAGDDASCPDTDQRGVSRPFAAHCDIGAYESEGGYAQTITFNALDDKLMGDADFSLSASSDSGLSVSFTSTTTGICTVSGSTVSLVSEGTCSIAASQAGNAIYNAATDVSRSFTVYKRDQNITFNALVDKAYGDADFSLSASSDSGLTVSFTSTTTGVCTVSGSTVSLVATGTCSITASQGGNSIYYASDVMRSFTVNKGSQTITFGALADKTVGDADFTLSATSTSGLPVGFASTTTGVCTVSGATVHLVAGGSCSITASQGGNANYNAAPDVIRSFSVLSGVNATKVNTTEDNAIAGDGLCTLREMINNANADADTTFGDCAAGSGADEILFDTGAIGSSTITITLNGAQLPTITSPVTITGTGAGQTILQASTCDPVTLPGGCTPANYRVLQVSNNGNLTLDGVTVRYGYGYTVGGGVFTQGTLDVRNSLIANNVATQDGSGIYSSGTLTVTTTTFSGNYAVTGHGTIANFNSATVSKSTFESNSVPNGGGGGIYCDLSTTLYLINSTFANNSAGQGGAIHNRGDATIINNTFASNEAWGVGRAIHNWHGTLSLFNNIVSNNTGAAATTCYNEGTLNSSVNNLIDDGTCGATLTADPLLGTLADNGGPTLTFALLAGSPAIDAGDDASCTEVDQRGIARPQGLHCDIGAFEADTELPQTITFGALADKTLGDADFTVSATADSGLPVSFASITTSVCTVSGTTVHLVGAGSCTITASQAGNAVYLAAADVARSFTVNQAMMTLTVEPSGSGSGNVSGNGIACYWAGSGTGGTCSGSYVSNATFDLSATPDACSSFSGWSGACTGQGTSCSVTMDQSRTVGANFQSLYHLVRVSSPAAEFDTVASGYLNSSGGTIYLRAYNFGEALLLARSVDVIFDSGWNCDFSGHDGSTSITSLSVVKGSVTLKSNTLVIGQ